MRALAEGFPGTEASSKEGRPPRSFRGTDVFLLYFSKELAFLLHPAHLLSHFTGITTSEIFPLPSDLLGTVRALKGCEGQTGAAWSSGLGKSRFPNQEKNHHNLSCQQNWKQKTRCCSLWSAVIEVCLLFPLPAAWFSQWASPPYTWFWCGIRSCFVALKAVFDEKSLFPKEIYSHKQKAGQLCERVKCKCSEGKIKRSSKQSWKKNKPPLAKAGEYKNGMYRAKRLRAVSLHSALPFLLGAASSAITSDLVLHHLLGLN